MGNNSFCKDCMGFYESLKVHGGNYFTNKGYNAYKVSFLRVDSVEYDFGLVGFSGNLSKSPPRILKEVSK